MFSAAERHSVAIERPALISGLRRHRAARLAVRSKRGDPPSRGNGTPWQPSRLAGPGPECTLTLCVLCSSSSTPSGGSALNKKRKKEACPRLSSCRLVNTCGGPSTDAAGGRRLPQRPPERKQRLRVGLASLGLFSQRQRDQRGPALGPDGQPPASREPQRGRAVLRREAADQGGPGSHSVS